ncbi:sigma 54-interacting transcriptional regulator [Desulfoscipio gibsoniae]|uniref:HTH-type transcriptional regulatory protein TyrR n=1 Tax=Desulfoscipio gibsoniae DSM 7213 TaxID=767817 RepID=R4KA88_9FIRM|nr:sigma 54-interacting transcriptional regulator [Desulfoscipio gibsoniae]AGL00083.1 PAS domain S-box [Desulfoscipio gibsoniae DSM 7213]
MLENNGLPENEINQLKLSNFLESLYNGVVIIDKEEKIIYFNQAACKIFNIKRSYAMGKPVLDVLPKTELIYALQYEKPRIGIKYKWGETFILANHTPIIVNQKVAAAASIFQDISDFEKVSNQLETVQELAAELNGIFDHSYDGIYVTDGKGKTLRVNKAYQRITGLSLEQLVGENMKDIVNQGLISESITFKILKEKKALTIKQTISTGKDILVTGVPIVNNQGDIVRVVTNVRDMTELNNLHKKLDQSLKLKAHFEKELSQLKRKYEGNHRIIAQSKLMQNVLELAYRLAKVDVTVLITGESGVGKELIAQLIHDNSPRAGRKGTLIKINCGAIPVDLLESELFGYEEGAFSGAKKGGKAGLFEIADEGTLFLDEVADLPMSLQVKLLRVLQEGEFTRLGGTKPIKVNVRIISATNKDLEKMVQQNQYRKDLYYRLNVVPVNIPPLKDRKEDILALIAAYLNLFNKKYGMGKSIAPRAMDLLLEYDWPGNVRELINTLERLMVTINEDVISVEDLPSFMTGINASHKYLRTASLKDAVAELERTLIVDALKKYKTTRKAAEYLGISQSALVKKANKYEVTYTKRWSQ